VSSSARSWRERRRRTEGSLQQSQRILEFKEAARVTRRSAEAREILISCSVASLALPHRYFACCTCRAFSTTFELLLHPPPMSTSKRKSPPPASSPSTTLTKRQRLSPAGASRTSAATSRAQSPLAHSVAPSPGGSLSSLTDSRGSSPDIDLATASANAAAAAAAAAGGAGDGKQKKKGKRKGKDGESDLASVVEEAAIEHPDVSAKTAPSAHPGTSANGRPTQGGKGKRGEDALEHAVAAREEVERRRVQLKEANGAGVAGPREREKDLKKIKAEDEEGEVEVVHGAEAEELVAAPVRVLPPLSCLFPVFGRWSRTRGNRIREWKEISGEVAAEGHVFDGVSRSFLPKSDGRRAASPSPVTSSLTNQSYTTLTIFSLHSLEKNAPPSPKNATGSSASSL
jgi:hypothetical protein